MHRSDLTNCQFHTNFPPSLNPYSNGCTGLTISGKPDPIFRKSLNPYSNGCTGLTPKIRSRPQEIPIVLILILMDAPV